MRIKKIIKFISTDKEFESVKKSVNRAGYMLTPPAFILNIWEWLCGLSANQVFTFIISILVTLFWFWKLKEQKLKTKKLERELNSE